MLNFFSSEDVTVPNGYVYTSHTGAKYVFLEGIWVNDSNMMLVDPSKYSNMYMCARAQIIEHNNSPLNKNKIGKKYIKENIECIYIGDNKFNSAKGIILENEQLTELMADDQRVYDVSKETLQKEWQALKFYILPPYNEDVSIPAGMIIQGYKYIPRAQRFIDLKTGEAVDPATTRRLTEVGTRMAREQANANKLIPLKSVLVQGDTRSEWNGSEFCDNAGNVVVPKHQVSSIFNAYKEFVEANPQDFPTLTNNSNKEQRFGSVDKPEANTGFNAFVKPQEKYDNISESTIKNDDAANEMYQQLKFIINDNEATNIPVGYRYKNLIKTVNDWVDKDGNKVDIPIPEVRAIKTNIDKLNSGDSRNSILKVGRSMLMLNQNRYLWNGDMFTPFGQNAPEIPLQKQQEIKQKYTNFVTEHPELFNDVSGSNASPENNEPKVGDTSVVDDENGENSTDKTSANNTGSVPNGIRITSGKGKTYQKQNGQWFDVETKKPLNSSASKGVEMAAQKQIEQHNADPNNIKIGSTVKSKSGKTYTYVGHNRFLSDDGKLMPVGAAQNIIDRFKAEKGASAGENDSESQPEEQPAQGQPESKPQQKPQGDSGNLLQDLAAKIKASPFAPKIKVLLTRGDKVSLMAADILLSGQRDDAVQILKSLNNNDE